MESAKKRNTNLDLIRTVAVFNVIGVHFFLNSGFYAEQILGKEMLILCICRSLFMTCVPLFLLLSGYLMTNKTLSVQYYKGLWKTVVIYLLASAACIIYRKTVCSEDINIYKSILLILAFQGDGYSWYIEMYISLFLMIPFFNVLYHSLINKNQKKVLLITLIVVTSLPAMVNNFNLMDLQWWKMPSISINYNKLLPGLFTGMYPLTYYFIGSYLREYGWNYEKKKCILLYMFFAFLFGCYNYYRSYGGVFIWGSNCDWMGENLITTVILFGILLKVDIKKYPRRMCILITEISKISLGIYLISWIADNIIYGQLLKKYAIMRGQYLKCFPIVIFVVMILSFIGSEMLYFLYGIGALLYRNIIKKLIATR